MEGISETDRVPPVLAAPREKEFFGAKRKKSLSSISSNLLNEEGTFDRPKTRIFLSDEGGNLNPGCQRRQDGQKSRRRSMTDFVVKRRIRLGVRIEGGGRRARGEEAFEGLRKGRS